MNYWQQVAANYINTLRREQVLDFTEIDQQTWDDAVTQTELGLLLDEGYQWDEKDLTKLTIQGVPFDLKHSIQIGVDLPIRLECLGIQMAANTVAHGMWRLVTMLEKRYRFLKRSTHNVSVLKLMLMIDSVSGRQNVNLTPTKDVSFEIRKLRAKLNLEEVMEKIEAMGISLNFVDSDNVAHDLKLNGLEYHDTELVDLIGIADGCFDVSVINQGDLVSFGMVDTAGQSLVDSNNLNNFTTFSEQEIALITQDSLRPDDLRSISDLKKGDYKGFMSASGKWEKPVDRVKVDLTLDVL